MKLTGILLSLGLAVPFSSAAPFVVKQDTNSSATKISFTWDANWNQDFQIHPSCNLTQTNQLLQAFSETKLLAQHAKDHTLRNGNLSKFYSKYFGDAPTGEVVGIFENVVSANKTGILFRCDDIDGNCKNDGWAGHWRGSNATDETVICDLSYTSRLFLSQVCSRGYTVSGSKNTVYWAGDLLHRIWHTDKSGQGVVGHYADTYDECLELGEHNSTFAVRNSASLRYYALDVYAYDIAVPGEGCTGDTENGSGAGDDKGKGQQSSKGGETGGKTTSSASQTATKTAAKSAEAKPLTTATKSEETDSHGLGSECHTHADGDTHCV